jgi:hypothetical protein
MCGSSVTLDSTGTMEAFGWAWQHLSVECNDKKGQHCGMSLTLTADFWNLAHADDVLATAWNRLARPTWKDQDESSATDTK